MKQTSTTTTRCCRSMPVPIQSSDIRNWRAEPAPDDKWTVYADYAVYGETHHASWLVGRTDRKIGPQIDE